MIMQWHKIICSDYLRSEEGIKFIGYGWVSVSKGCSQGMVCKFLFENLD